MSIATIRFKSAALGKHAGFNVIHPDHGDGPFPVLMQLHGYSDDSFSWLYNSNLARHAATWPMIVILPDGGTSRYLNLPYHERFGLQRYEDLLLDDIPNQVERLFRVRSGPWAIGGLSMGGFGALRLGLKFPERFASIWAHSAGLRPLDDVFLGSLDDPADADLVHLARAAQVRGPLPVISFDCGTEDELIDHNRAFDKELTSLGIDHTYREHPGAHTWDYWDEHVVEALAQHARILGVASGSYH